MSLISISNLTFCYDGSYDNIFDNVSFQIDTDWKLGFIGRNGRGKTTFLRLLTGEYDYRGRIAASVDFEYFPYAVRDASRNTADVLTETGGEIPLWRLQRELNKLEVPEDALHRPFSTLSNGEQTKVLLAVLFLRENGFPLIDEPTNHLDMPSRKLVAAYLNGKKGFLLVSHDRAFLDGCVDHILSINRTGIEVQSGNFSSWYENKQRQDHFETEQDAKLRKEVRRLEAAAREKAAWSEAAERRKIGFDPANTEKNIGRRAYQGAKSKKMMSRAKAIEGRRAAAAEEKSALLHNVETAEDLKLSPLPYPGRRLIELDRVAPFYESGKPVCRGVSFTVEPGDRVALRGRNGSGKSSLLKLICGGEIAHAGTLVRGGGLTISYVPQDTSGIAGSLDEFIRRHRLDGVLFRAILRKLDFSRAQFEKDLSSYSAGQKKKVLLARSLCERAHLYVWDEPLNYIDVLSRIQIEKLLTEYRPTLLFVEHDRAFCENVATKTVDL